MIQIEEIDEISRFIYLELAPEQIVYLQGLFEIYESTAIVRTMDPTTNLIALITTKDLLQTCIRILEESYDKLQYKFVRRPDHINPLNFQKI